MERLCKYEHAKMSAITKKDQRENKYAVEIVKTQRFMQLM
jgi:hypothetical protein